MSFIVVYLLIGLGYTVAHVKAFKQTLELLQTGEIPSLSAAALSPKRIEELRVYQVKLKEAMGEHGPSGKKFIIAVVMAYLTLRNIVVWPLELYSKFKAKV